MRNMVGRPVHGNDFYNRKRELKAIRAHLDVDHMLLLAPRRVGKTSLMWKLAEQIQEEEDFVSVFFTAGGEGDTEVDFVDRLFRTIGEHPEGKRVLKKLQKGPLGGLFAKLGSLRTFSVAGLLEVELGERAEASWKTLGEELVTALASTGKRWLVQVDELPLFVLNLVHQDEGGTKVRAFLDWFRSLRQQSPLLSENVRWLLAGSIGLDTVTERLNLGSTINDLRIQSLGPFSPETADGFLETMGVYYDLPLTSPVRQYIMERIGWLIPYHLQVVFSVLREVCSDGDRPPDHEAVDRVFEVLVGPGKGAYFDPWDQRLVEELGRPHATWARVLLTACCRDPGGATRAVMDQVLSTEVPEAGHRAEQLRWLIKVLVNDGYLVMDGDRCCFRSHLLRAYWTEKYGS